MHEGLLGSQRPVDLGPLIQQMGRLWEGFRFLISWNMTELVLKLLRGKHASTDWVIIIAPVCGQAVEMNIYWSIKP